MARRSPKHRRGHSRPGAPAPGRFYTPAYTPLPAMVRPRRLALGTRVLTLAPPVFPPTVRPSLMRTVRTDTNHRFSPPSRRPSPVSHVRALARTKTPQAVWSGFPTLGHQIPPRALHCARRSIRREVLLALGQGNGAGSRNRPKSEIRCK